jgi:hypothetical protein
MVVVDFPAVPDYIFLEEKRMHRGARGLLAAISIFLLGGTLALAQAPSESLPPGDESDAQTAAILQALDSQISERVFLSPEGRARMQDAAAGLTETQKFFVFTSHRKNDAFIGVVLNMVLPGLGSAFQADWGAGALMLGLRAVGLAPLIYSLGIAETGQTGPIPASLEGYLFVGGVVLVAASYVLCVVRPFSWVAQWNEDLALALGTRVSFIDLTRSRVSFQPDSAGTGWKVDLDLVSFQY